MPSITKKLKSLFCCLPQNLFSSRFILFIIIAAFLARIVIILNMGLRIQSGDEISYIHTTIRILLNHFDPDFYLHGHLFFYIAAFLYHCVFLIGKALGSFVGSADFILFFLEKSVIFYTINRAVAFIFSVGSIYIIYRIGTLLWNKQNGILAALLFAITPLSFEIARSTSMYSATNFCILLATWRLLCFAEKPKLINLYFAAGAFGLAISSDYYALFLIPLQIVIFLDCCWRKKMPPRRLMHLSFFYLVGTGIFFLTNPYSLLKLHDSMSSILVQAKSAAFADFSPYFPPHRYLSMLTNPSYFFLSLFFAIGIYQSVRKKNLKEISLSLFPMVNIILMSFSKIQLPQYIVHALPFMALIAAKTIAGFRTAKKSPLTAVLTVFFLVHICSSAANWYPHFYAPQTERAKAWIKENIPLRANILINPGIIPYAESTLAEITENTSMQREILRRYLARHPEENFNIMPHTLVETTIPYIDTHHIEYIVLSERDYDQYSTDWLKNNAVFLKGFSKLDTGRWNIRIYTVKRKAETSP